MVEVLGKVVGEYEKYNQAQVDIDNQFNHQKQDIYRKQEKYEMTIKIIIGISLLIIFVAVGFILSLFIKTQTTTEHYVSATISNNTECYITETGDCYHTANCGYLHSSKIKTTVGEAKKKGYYACSICWKNLGGKEIVYNYQPNYKTSFIISAVIVLVLGLLIFFKGINTKKYDDEIELAKKEAEKQKLLAKQQARNTISMLISDYTWPTTASIIKHVTADESVYINESGEIRFSDNREMRYVSDTGKCHHISRTCALNNKCFKLEQKSMLYYPTYRACRICKSPPVEKPIWFDELNKCVELEKKARDIIKDLSIQIDIQSID